MRIVLDGESLEVRAYLASQIGPQRRPFGVVRAVVIQPGSTRMVAQNATTDRVLYVGVEVTSAAGATAETVFGNTNPPNRLQDPTVDMPRRGAFADFVLMPGDELWVMNGDPASVTYSVCQVTF